MLGISRDSGTEEGRRCVVVSRRVERTHESEDGALNTCVSWFSF
jgi:hypothetical protein